MANNNYGRPMMWTQQIGLQLHATVSEAQLFQLTEYKLMLKIVPVQEPTRTPKTRTAKGGMTIGGFYK